MELQFRIYALYCEHLFRGPIYVFKNDHGIIEQVEHQLGPGKSGSTPRKRAAQLRQKMSSLFGIIWKIRSNETMS